MTNAFDSANYPVTEPSQLIAGDRVAWKRTDLGADYDPASYTLKYTARLEGDGTTSISITATASGTDFVVEVPKATTAAWVAGRYQWQAYIQRNSDSERVTVDEGSFEVLANRAASSADPRSHARIVLDAIEAVIENRATVDQQEYSINGRSLKRMMIDELIKLRTFYRAEVASEIRAENGTGLRKLKVTL